MWARDNRRVRELPCSRVDDENELQSWELMLALISKTMTLDDCTTTTKLPSIFLPSLFYCFVYSPFVTLSVDDITNERCVGDVDVVQGMKELFNFLFWLTFRWENKRTCSWCRLPSKWKGKRSQSMTSFTRSQIREFCCCVTDSFSYSPFLSYYHSFHQMNEGRGCVLCVEGYQRWRM